MSLEFGVPSSELLVQSLDFEVVPLGTIWFN